MGAGDVCDLFLPSALIRRVWCIFVMFHDVQVRFRSFYSWLELESFHNSPNPGAAVALWDVMVRTYALFRMERRLGRKAKREVYRLLMARSTSDDQTVLKEFPLRHLDHDEEVELLATYRFVANLSRYREEAMPAAPH